MQCWGFAYKHLFQTDSSFLSLSAETDVRNPQTVAPLEMESEDDMHDAYDGDYMDESDGIVGFVDDGDYGFVDNATDDLDDPDLSSGRPQRTTLGLGTISSLGYGCPYWGLYRDCISRLTNATD
eukprot:Gb_37131 [translate_table: standard]